MHVTVTSTSARKAVSKLTEEQGELQELVEGGHEVGEKDGPAIIPARFAPCPDRCNGRGTYDCGGGRDHRLSSNVIEMTCYGADLDDIPDDQFEALLAAIDARGLEYVCWHTHSHVPGSGKTRARLMFPFLQPFPIDGNPHRWSVVAWKMITDWLHLTGADTSCRNCDRIYYLPRRPSAELAHACGHQPGAPLDWRQVPGLEDALAAISSVHVVHVESEDEDSARPVDLDKIRADLERINDSILKRMLRGEALTPPPERRTAGEPARREAWRQVTVHIGNVVEGWESRSALMELVQKSYAAEVAESPQDYTERETIEELLERAITTAPQWKAEKKAREQAWYELRRRRLQRQSSSGESGAGAEAGPVEEEVVPRPTDNTPRNLTDLGNVDRFVAQYRAALRFVPDWGIWVVWDGKRWKRRDQSAAIGFASKTARSIYAEAAAQLDPDRAKALAKWASQSEGRQRIEAMVALARGASPMRIEKPDLLDADPMLLNCLNGTVNLRTGELRPHAQEDMITKLAPVEYRPDAPAAEWEKFLTRVVPTESVRSSLQEAAGYTLTGDVSEQVLFFLYGAGQNGKSTFIGAQQALLGDYATQGSSDLLISQSNEPHPTSTAAIMGARLVVCSETEQGKTLNEVRVKQLTGGDRITARYMKQDFFEFVPSHKFWLCTNHKPRVRGTDHAIWRRIRLIPFEETITEAEKDSHLAEKLRAEMSGILAWCLRGCMQWQRSGISQAQEIKEATQSYRDDQDSIAHFITECLEQEGNAFIATADLYRAYVVWCERLGEKPWTARSLSNALVERGHQQHKTTKARGFRGLKLVSIGARVALASVPATGAT